MSDKQPLVLREMDAQKLAAGLQKVIAMPDVKDKLTAMGLTVGYMSGAELGKREVAYREVWAKIIKDSGYQPQ